MRAARSCSPIPPRVQAVRPRAFTALAAAIAEELLPPVEMAGCSARMLELVEQLGR